MGRARAQRGAVNLARKLEEDQALRAKVIETPNTVYMRDFVSPDMQKKRQSVLKEFTIIMRAILESEGLVQNGLNDEELQDQLFVKDKIVDYVVMYLHAVGGNTETNKGVISERFKIGSLESRTDALWWFATWILADTCTAIYHSWQLKTKAAEQWIAHEYKLGTESWPKSYFGMPEMWLLFETVLRSTLPATWIKQHYVLWALMFMTGARIGSLCLPAAWSDTEMYFKWQDVTFRRFPDRSGIILEINLLWLKGQRQQHKQVKLRKGVTFTICPPLEAKNACVDLTWLLTTMAIERGLFGNQTLDDLENSTSAVLVQDPKITTHPVFRKGKIGSCGIDKESIAPLSAVDTVISTICRAAGISVRATSYCFRREALTAFDRNVGRELAKGLATHVPFDIGNFGYYDFGVGDVNVTEARLAEISSNSVDRNRLRQFLSSPAINNRVNPFDEVAFRKGLKVQLRTNVEWIKIDQAYLAALDVIRQKFHISQKFPARMAVELNALANGTNSTTGYTEDDLYNRLDEHTKWVAHCSDVQNGTDAVAILNVMYKIRKSLIARLVKRLRKVAIEEWRASTAPLSNEDVLLRTLQVDHPPLLDQTLGSDTLDDEFLDDMDEEYCQDDDNATLDALADGTVAHLSYQQEDTQDDKSSSVTEDYVNAKMRLLDLWNGLTEVDKGKQVCLLCAARPIEPEDVVFPSAFKIDRHVSAPTGKHVPGCGKDGIVEHYARWCWDEETEKFVCRICQGRRRFADYKSLSKHPKKDHQDFVKSLTE